MGQKGSSLTRKETIMNKLFSPGLFAIVAGALVATCLLVAELPAPSQAASHREAPLLAMDPSVDSTDFFAFRSYEHGREGFVTLIADYIPGELPPAGPNYYQLDETAVYEIKIDNTGDGVEDITYQFRFSNKIVNPDIVLDMAAPNKVLTGKGGIGIKSLKDPDYNIVQSYSVTLVETGKKDKMLAHSLIVPPANIGVRTTPDYEALAKEGVYPLPGGGRVFVGPRDDPFYIDLGSIFDTLNLRSITRTGGFDYLAGLNVHSIALEVPIKDLTRDGKAPKDTTDAKSVIGAWTTASRSTTSVMRTPGENMSGAMKQVSRLGNPLVNEVVIPLKLKNAFSGLSPKDDAVAAPFVLDVQLAHLMKAVFKIDIPAAPRNDLVAIFATGIPAGAVPGAKHFNTFLSDGKPHEMLRLNVAIPATPFDKQHSLGLLGGDVAGFPNGRRVGDDVTDIALRAVAGGTPFTPETNKAPNNELGDGVDHNDKPYLRVFPYVGLPHSGRPH
jgi:hypothetical protein